MASAYISFLSPVTKEAVGLNELMQTNKGRHERHPEDLGCQHWNRISHNKP